MQLLQQHAQKDQKLAIYTDLHVQSSELHGQTGNVNECLINVKVWPNRHFPSLTSRILCHSNAGHAFFKYY